jgi:adenylate kinase
MPPKVDSRCDRDGSELYTREDDKIESIKNRLSVYQSQTAPLVQYYREAGLLRDVDASDNPDAVFTQTGRVIRR